MEIMSWEIQPNYGWLILVFTFFRTLMVLVICGKLNYSSFLSNDFFLHSLGEGGYSDKV